MVYGIMVSMVSLKTVRTHGIWYHGIHGIDTNRQGRMVYGTHGTMVLLKGLGFTVRMVKPYAMGRANGPSWYMVYMVFSTYTMP